MSSITAVSARTTYRIDRSHSEAGFQVRHLLTRVRGHFAEFDGTVEFDAQNPAASRVDVRINAASIDTGEPARDNHLRSADFFDVENHEALTFTSTAIRPIGSDRYEVAGDLTIRGVSRPVTLEAVYLGHATDPWGNERIAFEAETTVNRKDYGLNWNAVLETGGFLVGDEVKISLSVQAVRQAE